MCDFQLPGIFIFALIGMLPNKSSFGSKGTGNGQFATPYGVTVGRSGKIYVADSGNNRIQIFDRTGKFVSHSEYYIPPPETLRNH